MEYAAFKENGDRSHIYILKVREEAGPYSQHADAGREFFGIVEEERKEAMLY